MAKEEFDKLGFASEEDYKRIQSKAVVEEGTKEGANACACCIRGSTRRDTARAGHRQTRSIAILA